MGYNFPIMRVPSWGILFPVCLAAALVAGGCLDEFDVPDADNDDARVFVRRCSLCHALPDPARMEYSQWERVVERMAANIRARNVPQMSDEERQQILNYLKHHARDAVH